MGNLGDALKILLAQRTLTSAESHTAFEAMATGNASEAEMGALLGLLALRVPTAEELTGAARAMRAHVCTIPTLSNPEQLIDTCGTGGAPKTFNASTAAAIVACAAGARVAKHGGRSRTGRGSAEVLELLGINVNASREVQAACLDELGICFCFAVHHHPASRNVAPVRAALGVPTIFNLLSPLINPTGAKRQLLGVYDARFLLPIAHALRALGTTRAIVFSSDDGLDELSISAPSRLVHVTPHGVEQACVAPEDLGLTRAAREAVVARDLEHAATIIREVVSGHERGPLRDMTLLAASGALLVAGLAESLQSGVRSAAEAIDSGRAMHLLQRWILRSHAG